MTSSTGAEKGAGSVERALAILELIDRDKRGWTISELSRKLEMPKSTTHKLATTLERLGYLKRDTARKGYDLTVKVCALGHGLSGTVDLAGRSLPLLRKLARRIRLVADLAVLDGDQALYVQQCAVPGRELDIYVGKHTNLHCTAVGKVLLSHVPKSVLRIFLDKHVFIRHTNKTIVNPTDLWNELERCREQRYAVDDEEEEMGVRCLAVPVFNNFGQVVAALGVAGTTTQITPDNIVFLTELMRRASERISQPPPWMTESSRS